MPRFESVKITRINIVFDWMNLINCRKLFLQQSSYFILLVFILSYSMLVIKFDLFFLKMGLKWFKWVTDELVALNLNGANLLNE